MNVSGRSALTGANPGCVTGPNRERARSLPAPRLFRPGSMSRLAHPLRTPEERCFMLLPSRGLMLATLVAVNSGTLVGAVGSELKPGTVAAFDAYVREAEERITDEVRQPDRFLYLDALGEGHRANALAAVRRGEVVVEALEMKAHGKRI